MHTMYNSAKGKYVKVNKIFIPNCVVTVEVYSYKQSRSLETLNLECTKRNTTLQNSVQNLFEN